MVRWHHFSGHPKFNHMHVLGGETGLFPNSCEMPSNSTPQTANWAAMPSTVSIPRDIYGPKQCFSCTSLTILVLPTPPRRLPIHWLLSPRHATFDGDVCLLFLGFSTVPFLSSAGRIHMPSADLGCASWGSAGFPLFLILGSLRALNCDMHSDLVSFFTAASPKNSALQDNSDVGDKIRLPEMRSGALSHISGSAN